MIEFLSKLIKLNKSALMLPSRIKLAGRKKARLQ
jgi:hypothetical protein